jgi:hypothetical protein
MKKLWLWWKKSAHKIGNCQARVILSLFYFIVAAPFALVVKLFFDPLKLKESPKASYWLPKETPEHTLERARKQY